MVIIFSKKEVDGLAGTYANPLLFDGNFGGATLVITKDDKIRDAAKARGIEVRGFKGPDIQAEIVEEKPLLTPITDSIVAPVDTPVTTPPKKRTRKPRAKKAD